jgi:hypothetical protein
MAEFMQGQTAKNPKTGQRIVFQKGQWVPMKPPKLSAQESAQLKAAREDAELAAGAARDGNRFLEINKKTGTGEIWSIPLASEIRGAFDPRYAEMQSLTNRMAPAQRQAGSGAMSDKDVVLFKRSVPNPDFPGPTNAKIVQRLQEEAKRKGDRAAFLDAYALNNGTLLGAEEEWQRRSSAPKRPAPAPKKPASGLAFGGRPVTPAEAAKLPKGTRFKTTDGRIMER